MSFNRQVVDLKDLPKQYNDELVSAVISCIRENKENPGLNKVHSYNPGVVGDPIFNGYHANLIAGTNMIAGSGPSYADPSALFKNILFNENVAVNKIIAMGSQFDHFYGDRKAEKIGEFIIDAKSVRENRIMKSHFTILHEPTNTTKEIDVSLLPLESDEVFDFVDKYSPMARIPMRQQLEEFWKLYQDVQQENVFIHCSFGESRTGHLVLMFELMREFDSIFASGKPDIIAMEIIAVLNRLRQSRSCLINHNDQLVAAIRSAAILHYYGLEKTAQLSADEPVTLSRHHSALFTSVVHEKTAVAELQADSELIRSWYY